MTTTPLFADNSHAGYDHACHDATIHLAAAWDLDPHDPTHQLLIAQRLSVWVGKLHQHATATLPADHNPHDLALLAAGEETGWWDDTGRPAPWPNDFWLADGTINPDWRTTDPDERKEHNPSNEQPF